MPRLAFFRIRFWESRMVLSSTLVIFIAHSTRYFFQIRAIGAEYLPKDTPENFQYAHSYRLLDRKCREKLFFVKRNELLLFSVQCVKRTEWHSVVARRKHFFPSHSAKTRICATLTVRLFLFFTYGQIPSSILFVGSGPPSEKRDGVNAGDFEQHNFSMPFPRIQCVDVCRWKWRIHWSTEEKWFSPPSPRLSVSIWPQLVSATFAILFVKLRQLIWW